MRSVRTNDGPTKVYKFDVAGGYVPDLAFAGQTSVVASEGIHSVDR